VFEPRIEFHPAGMVRVLVDYPSLRAQAKQSIYPRVEVWIASLRSQ